MLLQVAIRRIGFAHDAYREGSGVFRVEAEANDERVGDPTTRFDARQGRVTPLPAAQWWAELDVVGWTSVRFSARFFDAVSGASAGSVTYLWRSPYQQTSIALSTRFIDLVIETSLPRGGRFVRRGPSSVSVCRATADGHHCNRIVAGAPRVYAEIDPVVPTPHGIARNRPAFTTAITPELNRDIHDDQGPRAGARINPSVVPLVDDTARAVRVEVSSLWATGPVAERSLTWRVVSLAEGGDVAFVGPDFGRRVRVIGRREGEVRLDLMRGGELLSSFRALVRRPVEIPFRLNLLRAAPRAPAADLFAGFEALRESLATANNILAQAAVTLVPDPDTTALGGATLIAGQPGFFHVDRPLADVVGVPETRWPELARINQRPWVFNIAYAKSSAGASDQGAIVLYPRSTHQGDTITEHETPSTSWVEPWGLPPSAPALAVTMRLLQGQAPTDTYGLCLFERGFVHRDLDESLRAESARSGAGSTDYENMRRMGMANLRVTMPRVLVHEVCHGFNLFHRGDDFESNDGVPTPTGENIMNYGDRRCDIDVLQAKVIWKSPIVLHHRRA